MQYLRNIMSNTIPIFIINMEKDKERRAFMSRQMHDLGLHYEFVVGRAGDDPLVLAACDDALAIKEHGKVLMKGEKGCAFSHRSIYEKMLKENIKEALILEDDAVLPKDIFTILEKVLKEQGRSWEWLSFDYPKIGFSFLSAWLIASKKMSKKNSMFLVYAGIKFPFIIIMSLYELLRDKLAEKYPVMSGPKLFYRPLYNAGAYIVTQDGIKKMMPLLVPIRFSADRTPNQARVKTGLKMRWYVPRIVHQAEEDFGNTFTSNTII